MGGTQKSLVGITLTGRPDTPVHIRVVAWPLQSTCVVRAFSLVKKGDGSILPNWVERAPAADILSPDTFLI